jgi:hypothetical protein
MQKVTGNAAFTDNAAVAGVALYELQFAANSDYEDSCYFWVLFSLLRACESAVVRRYRESSRQLRQNERGCAEEHGGRPDPAALLSRD